MLHQPLPVLPPRWRHRALNGRGGCPTGPGRRGCRRTRRLGGADDLFDERQCRPERRVNLGSAATIAAVEVLEAGVARRGVGPAAREFMGELRLLTLDMTTSDSERAV